MIQKGRIMTIVLLQLVINKPPPWCRLCPSDLTVFSMDVCPRKANMRYVNKPISPPSILQAWKTGEIIDFSKIFKSSIKNYYFFHKGTMQVVRKPQNYISSKCWELGKLYSTGCPRHCVHKPTTPSSSFKIHVVTECRSTYLGVKTAQFSQQISS